MVEEMVRSDFDRARQKAFVHDLVAALARRPNDLIPYHELRRRVSPEGESYRGLQVVPIDQIVGSMDRFGDFDRAFLPRQRHTAGRWQNVDRAYYNDVTLPPIQLYKVGDVYFVKDGNHRVSVAREKGVDFIDAEVIEGHVRVPLYASMRPAELLLQAEYAEFLRHTNLDRTRPDHDIRPTALGRYDEIWQQIVGHQRWLSEIWDRPATAEEAAADWYDFIYCPIVTVATERGILDRFPDRTEADVYLWVMHHREELEQRYGYNPGPVDSATDYADSVRSQGAPLARLRIGLRGIARRAARALGGAIPLDATPDGRTRPAPSLTAPRVGADVPAAVDHCAPDDQDCVERAIASAAVLAPSEGTAAAGPG
ncbi:MAG: hypothetical protein AVDCRST_MAG73-3265 [uncultured Thermomicrobiales bacterium]|uniref:Transcriptional regulator n=1 Tax=uncultured Thermomicrobiales bacterium TaxID=1645740 RepID=A0A6J4UQZ0_9BACT|nr:MAG: hypothetical protein AVDCRST_MAG73-3265 [uncultured Thermomicrobiales bacterium]